MTPTISPAFGCSLYRPQHDDPATACLQQFSKALQIWSRTTLLATPKHWEHDLWPSRSKFTKWHIYIHLYMFWSIFHICLNSLPPIVGPLFSPVQPNSSKSSTSSGVWNIYPPQLKIYSGWELPCNGIFNGIDTIGNMNITVCVYIYTYIVIMKYNIYIYVYVHIIII